MAEIYSEFQPFLTYRFSLKLEAATRKLAAAFIEIDLIYYSLSFDSTFL